MASSREHMFSLSPNLPSSPLGDGKCLRHVQAQVNLQELREEEALRWKALRILKKKRIIPHLYKCLVYVESTSLSSYPDIKIDVWKPKLRIFEILFEAPGTKLDRLTLASTSNISKRSCGENGKPLRGLGFGKLDRHSIIMNSVFYNVLYIYIMEI